MKRLICVFLTVVFMLCLCACGQNEKELSAEEIYNSVSSSVVAITAESSDIVSSGTGFFFNMSNVVVTNYHVIDNCTHATITLSNGEKYSVKRVLGYNKEKDIAILEVDYSQGVPIEIRTECVNTGETVYAIGNSLGFLEGSFSDGIVSKEQREINGKAYIQTTASVTSGNSGGPLIDKNGKVVGIISAGFGEGLDLNLAIPIAEAVSIPVDNPTTLDKLFVEDSQLVKDPQLGDFADGVYTNGFIGIRCEVSEEWTVYSDAQLAQLNGLVLDAMTDEHLVEQLKKSNVAHLFYATAENGHKSINVVLENIGLINGVLLDEKAYVELSVEQLPGALGSMGLTNVTAEAVTLNFVGDNHAAVRVHGILSGIDFYEKIICIKVDSYFGLVTVASYHEDVTEDLLKMFTET